MEANGTSRESSSGGYSDGEKLTGGQKFHRTWCPVVGCGCLTFSSRTHCLAKDHSMWDPKRPMWAGNGQLRVRSVGREPVTRTFSPDKYFLPFPVSLGERNNFLTSNYFLLATKLIPAARPYVHHFAVPSQNYRISGLKRSSITIHPLL